MNYPPNPFEPCSQQPQQGTSGCGPAQRSSVPAQVRHAEEAVVRCAYAGWWARFAAAVVDFLIVGLPAVVLMVIVAAMDADLASGSTGPGVPAGRGPGGGTPAGALMVLVLGYACTIAFGLFQIYREGATGRTIGKRLLNIRVVGAADGRPVGFGRALARRACHILDGLACYIGYLWPLWDARKQTFADKVMNTVVVKA
ncbi:RDD family protein [Kitasatospora sp. NPDC008050]|uniref:RDD family protein n=1 Tax=Kitasatospora sp. NPDC008050 TaxID=3364021 RepID=UPI0036E275B1